MPSYRPSKNQRRPDLTPYRTQQRHQRRTAEPSSRTPPDGRHQSYDCLPRDASETEPFEPYPVISTPRRGGEGLSPVRGGSYDDASGPIEDRSQDTLSAQPAIVQCAKLELLSLFEWDEKMVHIR